MSDGAFTSADMLAQTYLSMSRDEQIQVVDLVDHHEKDANGEPILMMTKKVMRLMKLNLHMLIKLPHLKEQVEQLKTFKQATRKIKDEKEKASN